MNLPESERDQIEKLIAEANESLGRGDHECCLHLAREILSLDPENQAGIFLAARELRGLGRLEEAELLLSDAELRWPENIDILSIWCSLTRFAPRERMEEADRRSAILFKRFPDRATAYNHRAYFYFHFGDYTQAHQVIGEARKRYPQDTGVANTLADGLEREGRWSEAADVWKEILVLQPDHHPARTCVIGALRNAGRHEEAADLEKQ